MLTRFTKLLKSLFYRTKPYDIKCETYSENGVIPTEEFGLSENILVRIHTDLSLRGLDLYNSRTIKLKGEDGRLLAERLAVILDPLRTRVIYKNGITYVKISEESHLIYRTFVDHKDYAKTAVPPA